MTLQKLFNALAVTLALTLTLTACGNNGCEEIRETYLLASVKATGRLSMSSINAWALTEQGDSLMSSFSAPTEMEFILKPDTICTKIRLECTIDDSGDQYKENDTLTVVYNHYPYFLDMECGCSVFFEINDASITNHIFKGITLKNKEITNEETTNIELTY